MKHKIIIAVFVAILVATAGFAEASPYETVEINFTGGSHEYPYRDVEFYGVFSGPDGIQYQVPGFWDGGTIWKIRFVPTATGTWTYVTESNDPQLDNKTDSIICSGTAAKGWLTRDDQNSQGFKWSGDDSPYNVIGDCWWGHMSSGTVAGLKFPFASYQDVVNLWSAAGYNYAYCMLGTWYPSESDRFNEGGQPWVVDGNNLFDLNQPNPTYFQQVDRRIEYANNHGICISLSLIESKNQITDINIYKRLVRYVLARYAGANVGIWLVNEYNDNEGEPFTVENWDEIGDYAQTWNPYGHPISLHCLGSSSGTSTGSTVEHFGSKAWHDYNVQQGEPSNELTHDIFNYTEPDGKPTISKPFISSEFYMGWSSWIYTPEWELQNSWEVMMGGGYICSGHPRVVDAAKMWQGEIDSQSLTFLKYVSVMRDVMNVHCPKFNKRRAANDLVNTGYACRVNNEYFVVYRSSPGSVTIDLSSVSGDYSVNAINLRTGEVHARNGVSGGSSVSVSTPSSGNEWVIILSAVSPENTAPSVNAGSDATISLGASAALDGTVTDDGLPDPAAVTVTWSQISGPGTATFGNVNSTDTSASFSETGDYVLRLTADDGELTSSADVTIAVIGGQGDYIRFEAEDMPLVNYFVSDENPSASGGFQIRLDAGQGTATAVFNGTAGEYDIQMYYFDEDDGVGSFSITLNGDPIDNWTLNQSTGWTTRTVGAGIFLTAGDTLVITGVKNRGEHARVDYVDFVPISELNVTISTPANYEVASLQTDSEYYLDRTYTLESIPVEIATGNEKWIKTANSDKAQTSDSFLQFTINQDSKVFVAYDHRATSLPNWLSESEGFSEETSLIIGVSEAMDYFKVYSKTFSEGTVTLGGNLASGAANVSSNYIVIVQPF